MENNKSSNIVKFFSQLKDDAEFKKHAFGNETGRTFENWIMRMLSNVNIFNLDRIPAKEMKSEIVAKEQIEPSEYDKKFISMKRDVLNKKSMEMISNPFPSINNSFVWQPFGTQNYPDFLFFVGKKVLPIEIKYSKKDDTTNLDTVRPMWNSNLPKGNAIYIFGVRNNDVTFFLGSDILDSDARDLLVDFFDKRIKKEQYKKIAPELMKTKNPFGFFPYIRTAYENDPKYATRWDNIEKKVVKRETAESYFSTNRSHREENVINFLKDFDK